ncbi:Zn-ribbon domain-containing OB-fold protein [Shouchella clausii]|uniref:Zn-ribbon domain-containing OB-fold protein n=1 Tax=Shouchella clausii TaxID=79880 RepID=UPI000B973539|nr:OB-fold domain-containing protein [Shouchella clausii]PAD42621.1 hypothetical protein CHH54_11265 [Bacillus sp. 7520-S]AST96136.1 hypothetical protein BC8716_09330 [Shouchella clausii]MCR1288919.1 OB-fold domain-containing protein [Shouchella clausii]MEB5471381.1 OB-fold domain-containing protein [Shouchella clausii]PAE97677.1 hypothetical protein CHH71_07975 [Shouchella clausii]
MNMPASQCRHCGRLFHNGKSHCSGCDRDSLDPVDLSGKGNVYSYTEIYAAPKRFVQQAPYLIVLVEMEHGLRVTGRMLNRPVQIGDRVELHKVEDHCYYFAAL